MFRLIEHSFIFITIIFTVYSQLIMRWQVSVAGEIPSALLDKVIFIINLLMKPWVLSGIISTFLAGVSWMLAMTRFEVSYAYPFVSLNYILILIASTILFNESLSLNKLIGSVIVISGIIIIAKG